MDLLKKRILEDGIVLGNNVLKVDSFLNHQIDVALFNEIGLSFKEYFKDKKIDKILTIEASGIGLACVVAQHFNCVPVVFAKKTSALNLGSDIYHSKVYSYTKQKEYQVMVSKRYLNQGENILIIDDFLANGKAILGLQEIIEQAGANLQGVGIVIEKGFQGGGDELREKGIDLKSLAIVDSMENGQIKFRD